MLGDDNSANPAPVGRIPPENPGRKAPIGFGLGEETLSRQAENCKRYLPDVAERIKYVSIGSDGQETWAVAVASITHLYAVF